MFYYLLIIPSIVVALCMVLKLYRTYTHDKVLYRFCQLRRKLIKYLNENQENLSFKEYKDIRDLLELVSNTIHYFDDYKIKVFNFKVFIDLIDKFMKRVNSLNINKVVVSNKEIAAFKAEYTTYIFAAFFAYVPFLKSRLILKFVYYISIYVLSSLGMESSKKFSKGMDWFVRNQTIKPNLSI